MQIDTYRVVPAIPERLARLPELAVNLLWSWDEEMRVLFTRLNRDLWEQSRQNPVLQLALVSHEELQELAQDESFLSLYDRTCSHLQSYLDETTWWDKRYSEKPLIAYFSAEYGLTECLPLYSGGLGVLAAHHLKSASDLGVPLVGVGLLYQQGYFHQYLTSDGWQQETYQANDFYTMPLEHVHDSKGKPIRVELDLAGEQLQVEVWKATVGRIPLYLLDTNVPENREELQNITNQLYGGDQETRIRQEIVLGIGGLRALHRMNIRPVVCHMNEGHSAFLSLERIRVLMKEEGLRFHEALEAARAGGVFTTHTPVPAGFDVFPPELMDKYFATYLKEVGVSREDLLALGSPDAATSQGSFNMAGLAVRTSAFINGVSRLHGEISRSLLRPYAPQVPEQEIPVGHVTNGAHTRSCVSKEMAGLFDRYLGSEWWRRPGQPETWDDVESIPDEELWSTHERRRERLVAFARKRLMQQTEQRGGSPRDVERARGVLNTRALTIGFARRFATYKRATLLLSDMERLSRILLDTERPVQFIFAGKAHPNDGQGKEMLKSIVSFCRSEEYRRHAVFLEDYDLVVARYLVQGVDVWLNTPRRGLEASGTSGMKVLPNGGLNLSVLDGWWCEADAPELGWAIGKGEEYSDHAYQDSVESNALYDLLEKEIVPIFYGRQADGIPRAWLARMKKSLKLLSPTFSTNRMLWEYSEGYYLPAARYYERMSENHMKRARGLAEWKRSIQERWKDVRVVSVEADDHRTHQVGEGFGVKAEVELGSISPEDVAVELYYGRLDAQKRIQEPDTAQMTLVPSKGKGVHRYRGTVPCGSSGMHGFSVRVRPAHPDSNNVLCTGLMTWR